MSEEIILRYTLNHDQLYKGGDDYKIICRLDIEPSLVYRTDHKSVACDICLVLDGSGSMEEPFAQGVSLTKREGVITAAQSVVDHLDNQDTVSLVFYDSQAYNIGTCFPGTAKDEIRQKIKTLDQYSGATNFEAALKMARTVLSKGRNASRRIIFLTDGQVNQGDAKVVQNIVQELSRQGVTIDALGVGGDFNFKYMQGLSGASNGRTFLLGTPEEARQRFEELLISAQKVVANNVFMTVLFPKNLRDIEAYQWLPEMRFYGAMQPDRDGRTHLEVNVQTIRQDRRNIFFFKARMDPPATDYTRLLANLRLDFDLPPISKTGLQENLNIHVNFTDEKQLTESDTTVDDGFIEVELVKLDEQFQALRGGDWQKALTLLEEMRRRAQNLGDRQRLDAYNRYRQKLKTDHSLSDDDFNQVGSLSSQSTQVEEGYLEDSDEAGIWDSL